MVIEERIGAYSSIDRPRRQREFGERVDHDEPDRHLVEDTWVTVRTSEIAGDLERGERRFDECSLWDLDLDTAQCSSPRQSRRFRTFGTAQEGTTGERWREDAMLKMRGTYPDNAHAQVDHSGGGIRQVEHFRKLAWICGKKKARVSRKFRDLHEASAIAPFMSLT